MEEHMQPPLDMRDMETQNEVTKEDLAEMNEDMAEKMKVQNIGKGKLVEIIKENFETFEEKVKGRCNGASTYLRPTSP